MSALATTISLLHFNQSIPSVRRHWTNMATTQGSEIEVVNLLLHLHSQVWCVWACGGNIHTDDDNV